MRDDVLERLEGRLFVAHNARFDYGFLRSEFRRAAEMARDAGADVAMADTPAQALAFLREGGGDMVMIDVEADIAVERGVMEADARRGLSGFLTRIGKGRPHVTLKIARSHDGFVGRRDMPVKLTGATLTGTVDAPSKKAAAEHAVRSVPGASSREIPRAKFGSSSSSGAAVSTTSVHRGARSHTHPCVANTARSAICRARPSRSP